MFDNPSKTAIMIILCIGVCVFMYQSFWWNVERQLNQHGMSFKDPVPTPTPVALEIHPTPSHPHIKQ